MAKAHDWRSIPTVMDVGETLSPGLRSAARPFRVLEFFDEIRRPARAREIWERLELPQSTTSVLLSAMTAMGFLDYDPLTRTYQPSLRVTLLGSWRDGGRLRSGALMTMLEDIAKRTSLSASLSNRSGIFIRYVQTVQQERVGIPRIKLAARRYAVWSTAGIVLLTGVSESERGKLLRHTLAEDEPHARLIDAAQVPAMVAQARRQGWFTGTGLATPDARAIAMVVPAEATGYGEPLALTLANGTPDLGMSDEALADIMAEAIDGLGQ